jgi:hypothetical protein
LEAEEAEAENIDMKKKRKHRSTPLQSTQSLLQIDFPMNVNSLIEKKIFA